MATETKQYLIAGIVVEAAKSEGGGFYDITVSATGEKMRYLVEVFETVAKPYSEGWVTTEDGPNYVEKS